MPARIGILIGPKGRGSNMRAIEEACRSGEIDAEVSVVVSPKEETPAVQWARAEGLNVQVVLPGEDEGKRMLQALGDIDLLCLAGFLRVLPGEVLDRLPNRVLNIHPALLPKYGGKGMYGMHVHEAVVAAGERESGCTVHVVTPKYDEGPIVLQLTCAIDPTDTAEQVAGKVLALEHRAYPMAIRKVLGG